MNDYTLLNKLGEGAFSVVYKVKRKEDGKDYAMKKMKIMTLSEKQLANCLNEVRILASLENPYILSYKDSFFDELTNTFCIVTELLEGGDIFQLINRHKNIKKMIDQQTIWRVAGHALKGLASLHQINILHRDIKSANIFLSKDQTHSKLADLNVSIVSANGMAKTQTGTPYYASPEVWMEKPYNSKCDIWSLGCVLYEMASLKPPFIAQDLKTLKKTIIGGVYKRIPMEYSSDLQSFIRLCLKVDTKERLSAIALLETEFIKKKDLFTKEIHSEELINSQLSKRLLEKILPPKKKQFKMIREKLPKNKFDSLEKSYTRPQNNNISCIVDKENMLNFLNTNKITKKDELPSIKRSSSLNNKNQNIIKYLGEKITTIESQSRPPLPKKSLRA